MRSIEPRWRNKWICELSMCHRNNNPRGLLLLTKLAYKRIAQSVQFFPWLRLGRTE